MRSKRGKLFLVALAFFLSSCRKDYPPKTDLCELDGFGGGDCVLKDGSEIYKSPSQMQNFMARSPEDEAAFTAWCYQTTPERVKQIYEQNKQRYYIFHGGD